MRKGQRAPESVRAKLRLAHLGVPLSKEHSIAIRNGQLKSPNKSKMAFWKGKKRSPESIQKFKVKMMGNQHTKGMKLPSSRENVIKLRQRGKFETSIERNLKTSIITLDENKAHLIERGVTNSRERFKMLEKANKLGVAATTVRFRPFVLNCSADYPFTENSRQQIEEVMKMSAEHGCYSMTTEFLCWESRASNNAITVSFFPTSGFRSGLPFAISAVISIFGYR